MKNICNLGGIKRRAKYERDYQSIYQHDVGVLGADDCLRSDHHQCRIGSVVGEPQPGEVIGVDNGATAPTGIRADTRFPIWQVDKEQALHIEAQPSPA